MKIERVVLRQIRMPLLHVFETSFGRTSDRDIILVEAVGEGVSGWGEVTAGENPFYNEEWTGSAWPILRDYVAPRVIGAALKSAEDVAPLIRHIRGHNMARGGLEAAVWDLEARCDGVPRRGRVRCWRVTPRERRARRAPRRAGGGSGTETGRGWRQSSAGGARSQGR